MGFKSGGDNKETLTIQAADGEQTKLILKSTEECFIRLESDTNNDVEAQNPYIEFIQDEEFNFEYDIANVTTTKGVDVLTFNNILILEAGDKLKMQCATTDVIKMTASVLQTSRQ